MIWFFDLWSDKDNKTNIWNYIVIFLVNIILTIICTISTDKYKYLHYSSYKVCITLIDNRKNMTRVWCSQMSGFLTVYMYTVYAAYNNNIFVFFLSKLFR